MKNNAYVLLFFFILILLGCASVNVTVHYDQATNFGHYQTFYFVKPTPQQKAGAGALRNPIFTKEIMDEIKSTMEGKGFVEANTQKDADLWMVFYAFVQQHREYVPPAYRVGRWGHRVWQVKPGQVIRYKEGTLVIDMVDNKNQELVWQGVGTGILDRMNPTENLLEASEKILEKFPPEQ